MSAAPQIVCQVCFTQQDNAWDCVVCGSPLHDKPKHWAVPVQQVEGLELTRFEDGGNVSFERIPDLVLTSADDGIDPLPDELEGLELTRYGEVEVAAEIVPEFEATALVSSAPAAVAAALACRYCGTPWQEGTSVFCARCGMRVSSRVAPRAPALQTGQVSCRGCGMPDQVVGSLCRSCQQPIVS